MAELHTTYSPLASATNVKSVGIYPASGNVPSSSIDDPDNPIGTNSVVVPNQGSGIVLGNTTENNQTQKTVHGRLNISTVINNPA